LGIANQRKQYKKKKVRAIAHYHRIQELESGFRMGQPRIVWEERLSEFADFCKTTGTAIPYPLQRKTKLAKLGWKPKEQCKYT
jgi:hypothetical protein